MTGLLPAATLPDLCVVRCTWSAAAEVVRQRWCWSREPGKHTKTTHPRAYRRTLFTNSAQAGETLTIGRATEQRCHCASGTAQRPPESECSVLRTILTEYRTSDLVCQALCNAQGRRIVEEAPPLQCRGHQGVEGLTRVWHALSAAGALIRSRCNGYVCPVQQSDRHCRALSGRAAALCGV